MKVKELIKELEQYDQELEVILSSDEEGNGYSPLSGIEGNLVYEPYSKYRGEIHIDVLTEELKEAGFSEEDQYDGDDGIKVIVIYPAN
jgi:hypothetical protein